MADEKKYPKIIENVRCIEVTKHTHKFVAPDIGQANHLKVFTMSGSNRPSNVGKGDVGRMEYKSVPHEGAWWFEKYKTITTVITFVSKAVKEDVEKNKETISTATNNWLEEFPLVMESEQVHISVT